ncbi:TlpA family protein disulfide reductase [Tahibacter amnicola]|uniref:TlpA family protein disulfide reductase n=1 Tax=Tahibacter amnicola TaxID=2976241 RepID=A0ABY6BI81_9GAMM|nr:TlpA disulfide reductase family protein [Tahibacter amnicola]UXI68795.1 TlpA family protein disulfide reductase [Tahibacter amnicola]
MSVKRTIGVIALALAAGTAGLVSGTFLTGQVPPPWITSPLSRTEFGRKLADAWIEAAAPRAPQGVVVAGKGDRRPDLSLLQLDGSTTELAQWDGKVVLLNFWATWCAPCREEMPALDKFQQAWSPKGVQVVGLALDDAASVKEFLAGTPVAYPIVLPPPSAPQVATQFGNTYGVLPFSVLIGRDGRIVATRPGALKQEFLEEWIAPHL